MLDSLLDIPCVDRKARGLGFTWHFRSVREVNLNPAASDPAEARQLLEQIREMWNVEPLAPLLRVCEQQQMSAAGTAEVATPQPETEPALN